MEETENAEATTTTETMGEEPNGADAADLEKWKGYAKTWEKRAKERDRELKRLKDAQAVKAFWRSVDLTGNQTFGAAGPRGRVFWRSVDLTGNQTDEASQARTSRFGAVLI